MMQSHIIFLLERLNDCTACLPFDIVILLYDVPNFSDCLHGNPGRGPANTTQVWVSSNGLKSQDPVPWGGSVAGAGGAIHSAPTGTHREKPPHQQLSFGS